MRRKMITLCVTALLILTCTLTVFAQDFDPEKTGAISVTLTEQHDKEPIVGAELSVYYVATAHMNANGNSSYVYSDTFENCGIDMADPSLASKLEAFVLQHHVPSLQMTTDETGTATCKDLALGLYFVRQTGAVEGFAPCTPFMVTVPSKNAEGYVYEVNASPKTEVARLTSITIKKVWNTDASTEAADRTAFATRQCGQACNPECAKQLASNLHRYAGKRCLQHQGSGCSKGIYGYLSAKRLCFHSYQHLHLNTNRSVNVADSCIGSQRYAFNCCWNHAFEEKEENKCVNG